MSTKVDIRRATIGDAVGIAHLISELGYPCTANQMKNRLSAMEQDMAYATFVAESDRALAGMIGAFVGHIYEQDEPMGRIIALSIRNDFRRTGLGTSLVQVAEHWLGLSGVSTILVNSGFDREEAHKFYERVGYIGKGVSFVKRIPQ